MSKTEQIACLVGECLDRSRSAGYTLATLMQFLDELRDRGQPEADIQRVDFIMRHILKDVLAPDHLPVDITESPTGINAADTTKMAREQP